MSKTWITDNRGNRCSVEYFGSEDAAKAALATLKGCSYCSYCSDCSDCSYCSRCSDTEKIVSPVPVIEHIHKQIYAAVLAPGALDMGTWHRCKNTHCRAGWAVTLAGDAGRALERFYNTELAAMLIYDASDPNYKINPARFYDDNNAALADMRRLAEAV